MASVGRVSTDEAPANPKRIVAGKRFTFEKRPRAKERVSSEVAVGNEEAATFDWKPLATKVGAVVGGVLVLGACAWFAISWRNSSINRKNENAANSPFGALAHLSFLTKRSLKTPSRTLRVPPAKRVQIQRRRPRPTPVYR